MINEFKYGQTLKIWPSPLRLSLYNAFKSIIFLPGQPQNFALNFFWKALLFDNEAPKN